MTQADIANFQAILSIVEQADDPSKIPWKFERIRDFNDEDSIDCLLLKYYGERVGERGHIQRRVIWTCKVPIPSHVRKAAEDMMRRQFSGTAPAPRRRKLYITDGNDNTAHDDNNMALFDVVTDVDWQIEQAVATAGTDSRDEILEYDDE
jgi:hypothetical protein